MSKNNHNNSKPESKAFGEGRLNGKKLSIPMRMIDFDDKSKWQLGTTKTINSRIPDMDEAGVTINHSVTYYEIETLGTEKSMRMLFVNVNEAMEEAWSGHSRSKCNQYWSTWKGFQNGFKGEASRQVREYTEQVEALQTEKGSIISQFLFKTKVDKAKDKAKKEMLKAIRINPDLASSWSEDYIVLNDLYNDPSDKEVMDDFVKKVSDEGYVISHGKTLEGILDEMNDDEQEKYNKNVDKQTNKANKSMKN
ncbi:predicted protein [Chaetoceros tenuissimus]|uniref:Uncharacterized protein n=1 Tax=Chaetoceros tenuissimus TaxID=426638 RepID=A0AAD3CJY0_9STRA|nr:predicted protein [Chaetoceros tenuissimus]